MNPALFKLALERLQPEDWALFESLSSNFLSSDLGALRTMASPSGDGGRDSELFCQVEPGKSLIVAQYSVTSDWRAKIRSTRTRLGEKFPDARILIYTSNHQIGAQADELRSKLLQDGLVLDVRDRNWFLERATSDSVREGAAQELVDRIARPYLAGEDVINKPTSPLTSGEARAALVYLGMQWQDDVTEKGLTKLSFDALVRAALRHTHSDNRMKRSEIHGAVLSALTYSEKQPILNEIDRALLRLKKRYIRHWERIDEFCLMHEEHQRILVRLAERENEESSFYAVVEKQLVDYLNDIEKGEQRDIDDLKSRVPRVIEQLFLKRGEAFVSAVLNNRFDEVGEDTLKDIIFADVSSIRPKTKIAGHYPKLIVSVIWTVLREPDEVTQLYLRRLSNSYTLLSFLNQTPDVQSATRKLFSFGTIWLDTTVLLPLFVEQLEDSDQNRRFTKALLAANKAGIKLRVTSGVLQEVSSHMSNAITCSHQISSEWRGRTPFVYRMYLQSGRPPKEFRKWLTTFRGTEQPEEDIAQYLYEFFNVRRQDLLEASRKVSKNLWWTADRLWTEAHNRRRPLTDDDDPAARQKLIQHDLESYLGVVALRQSEQTTELGFQHWFLTLDKLAWEIRDNIKVELKKETPHSPLMSMSYLLNNMTFGPSRNKIGKAEEMSLPIILDVEMSESMPYDIVKIANKVREENEGMPEHVIRRNIRDEVNKAKRHGGWSVGP